jgi:hypothetical protein
MDRIARPARGRFFPVTVAETARLIRDLELAAPAYRKRLDIWFQNPAGDGVHGCEVAALYPRDEIIVYSLPDHFDRLQAKAILEMALRALAERGKDAEPSDRRRKAVSFRAYFALKATLTVTQRTRRGMPGTYRMGDKFAHAFKPKRLKTEERVVGTLDATEVTR